MLAVTGVPVWLAEIIQTIVAIAAALSAISALVMAIVNWRKLNSLHETVRRVGRRAGLTDDELRGR